MNYPDDYNVPTFAAGKSIALSRAMGIGIIASFFIIICLCCLLVWTMRSVHVEPYILATGGINDQWQIIKPTGEQPEIEMTGNQIIQQSLVWKFVQQWFTISPDTDENEKVWKTSCARTDCDGTDTSNNCAIFCDTSDALFIRFKNDILPEYKKSVTAHEYWVPDVKTIRVTPIGNIMDAGGTWRVQMSVKTSAQKNINIIAYAKVARDTKTHTNPKTLGYYIADFNAYRMN